MGSDGQQGRDSQGRACVFPGNRGKRGVENPKERRVREPGREKVEGAQLLEGRKHGKERRWSWRTK